MVEVELHNSWVWVVTNAVGATRTFLNRLVSSATATFTLNAPATFEAQVPSDDPEVNIPSTGSDPFVAMGNRLLYGLRREGGEVPYVCRFAGVIYTLQDEATPDAPVTHLTAYDPWQWLYGIPVVASDGSLPSDAGLTYTATHGNAIALDVIGNGLALVEALNPGNPNYLDVASGTLEVTDPIDITFQQGCSVGEALRQLTDTGSLDIVMRPIYDPKVRPGKLAVLNIYNEAGSVRDAAVFSWDRFPRSLVGIDRLRDGTQLANVAQYYAGGASVSRQVDAGSVAKYGQYWTTKNYPPMTQVMMAELVALAAVELRKKGKVTITVDPVPERSADPFTEYYLGDKVPVWAGALTAGGGSSFREPLTPGAVVAGQWKNPLRVYQIPITFTDVTVETVTNLLLTDPNATD